MSCLLRLASLLCLLSTSAVFCSATASNLTDAVSVTSENAVVVSVYYETLCPYCAEFIVNHLAKVFDEGLISIINLRMIPWGNALVQSDGSFICQHGPDECFLNAIEACTITIYPDVDRHFRFVYCIARLSLENRISEWMSCFQASGLANAPIDCYVGGYGNVLENYYAAETSRLNPPHRFVPWVVVNDQPLQEDFNNFVSYICKAYSGTPVPDACKFLPAASIDPAQKETLASSVCFLGQMRNLTSPEQKYLTSNMTR